MADTEIGPTEEDSGNVFRIMVATDNHLGYGEKNGVRGEDSFIAFEEILEYAVSEDVDMILLGGDLFHDAVPSQNTMYKCIELLRRYTFGDKPVSLEMLSDQTFSFYNAINQSVNYEDPNLNIAIPVFSIHGNHDDPSGFGRRSSLDLLSTAGLVNYFGRWTDLTKVEISPILLRKGESKLALYGLSHIADARLARLFKDFKVSIDCPDKDGDEWFHLMVVHQNRADRGPKNYLPEEALPDFLHLVIWGHEHDCLIEPSQNAKRGFYVSQPGSSVPTSLAEGESLKKHVGILEIYKTKFNMRPLPLLTVRPFVYESINLVDYEDELKLSRGDISTKVHEFARKRVEAMIEKSKELLTGHPKQPTLPIIRLRLVYLEEACMFNTIRFGQGFATRVANPEDAVTFKKVIIRSKKDDVSVDMDAMKRAMEQLDTDNSARVEELVDRYFEEVKDKNPLKLLHSKALSEMTYRLVERRDANAAENIVKFYKERAVEHLMESLPIDENIDSELSNFRVKHNHEELLKMLDSRGLKAENQNQQNAVDVANTSTTARGRRATGRGRGRATATTGAASTRAKPEQLNVSINTTRSGGTKMLAQSAKSTKRVAQPKTYYISDDSD